MKRKKRKRGRPATGYKLVKIAELLGMSLRTVERIQRIRKHNKKLEKAILAKQITVRDAERLVIIDQRDPGLLYSHGHLNFKDAIREMKKRNVILLPEKSG